MPSKDYYYKNENKGRNVIIDTVKIIITTCIIFHHYQQHIGAFFPYRLNFYGGDSILDI